MSPINKTLILGEIPLIPLVLLHQYCSKGYALNDLIIVPIIDELTNIIVICTQKFHQCSLFNMMGHPTHQRPSFLDLLWAIFAKQSPHEVLTSTSNDPIWNKPFLLNLYCVMSLYQWVFTFPILSSFNCYPQTIGFAITLLDHANHPCTSNKHTTSVNTILYLSFKYHYYTHL